MRLNSDYTADPTNDQTDVPTDALTVGDAAKALGITTEAARMRVKRGTLNSTRINGTVYVLLDQPNLRPNSSNDRPNPQPNGAAQRSNDRHGDRNGHDDALVDALQDRIASLERQLEIRVEELRRKDTIIMSLTQRVPELLPAAPAEARSDARDGHETDDQGDGGDVVGRGADPDRQESVQRSWWRRMFGG